MINFSCKDIEMYSPAELPSFTITNPPWDRRLEGADEAWKKLGHFAKEVLPKGTVTH